MAYLANEIQAIIAFIGVIMITDALSHNIDTQQALVKIKHLKVSSSSTC